MLPILVTHQSIPYKEDLFYSIVLVLALGHDLLRIIFSMIKYNTALTFTGMIGAGDNDNNKLYKNIHNNKARLKGISLSIHNVERNWYFGLLAATLIVSVAISAEFSRASSKPMQRRTKFTKRKCCISQCSLHLLVQLSNKELNNPQIIKQKCNSLHHLKMPQFMHLKMPS